MSSDGIDSQRPHLDHAFWIRGAGADDQQRSQAGLAARGSRQVSREVIRAGLERAQHVELAGTGTDDDRGQGAIRKRPRAGMAYLLEQLEGTARGVEPAEHGERRRIRAGQDASVLCAAGELDAEAIRRQLLDDRLAEVPVGLDDESARHRRRSSQLDLARAGPQPAAGDQREHIAVDRRRGRMLPCLCEQPDAASQPLFCSRFRCGRA